MKISIIIPAYNEEKRIGRTLRSYYQFFEGIREQDNKDFEIIVVPNGCTDNTFAVVTEFADEHDAIIMLETEQAGKGIAVRAGFLDALKRPNDIIGFVDADLATEPQYFYDLILALDTSVSGVIASRYAPGAHITPPRPLIKRWGSKLLYEPLVRLLFGLNFYDLQCGAKVFKREVIEKIAPKMKIDQWAFDIEALYLCKRYNFKIKEHPTIWHDQKESKLSTFFSGISMLKDLITLWFRMKKRIK